MDEVLAQDATEQARLIRDGEISGAELLDAVLARIEALNPKLNAVIARMDDEARRQLDAVDPAAPFAGVPFVIKDLVAEYGGTPLSEGSRFLKGHFVSPHDSTLVERQKRAGLVICGKTNTPEFGLLPTTEPEAWGPTRNPWDTGRTPGGSSGGSAAAVAARIVAMGHANDGGGSIRIPAACCGLFGLKPTRARNPMGPDYGDAGSGMAVEHAVTRSVRDSAGLLDATAGPAPGDPYWAPPPKGRFAAAAARPPGRLRIAASATPSTGVSIDPEVQAGFEATCALLAELGHEVVEAEPAYDRIAMLKAFARTWTGFASWAIKDWARRTGRTPMEADFEANTWRMYQNGERMTGGDYLMGIQDLQMISRQVAAFFEDYDVWLTPTIAVPPAPLGYFAWDENRRDEFLAHVGEFSGFTAIANATGQPAMSLPLCWSEAGLPIGMQVIGRFGDEETLFSLAGQLEQARPWAGRVPAL